MFERLWATEADNWLLLFGASLKLEKELQMLAVSPNQQKLERWRGEFRVAVETLNQPLFQQLLGGVCATAGNISAPMFEGQSTALHQLLVMSRSQRALPKAAVEMAVLLVQHGASLDAKDQRGQSPLDLLQQQGQWRMIHVLLDAEEGRVQAARKVA